MKLLITLITLAAASYGFWWTGNNHPEIKTKVIEFLDFSELHSLEIHHAVDQIKDAHSKTLLKKTGSRYLDSLLKFYPYLLLEVKFSSSMKKTKEGVILWDLTDGEMIIDTKDWEKTHGFGDCIDKNVHSTEYKILDFLARKGPVIPLKLASELRLDTRLLEACLRSCHRKGLVVQTEDGYRLHLEKPKLMASPETKLDQKLTTQIIKKGLKIPKRFSNSKIEKMAAIAFGKNFSIRRATLVYLPVYSIVVQNPDGSSQTSYWNASNGKRLGTPAFYE